MTTLLDKELKREVIVDGAAYVIAIDPDGVRLTGKGRRKPAAQLCWRDLLTGAAALAVALNASLARPPAPAPSVEVAPSQARAKPRVAKKLTR